MRIQPKILLLFLSPLAILLATAYIQWGTVGLPPLPSVIPLRAGIASAPHGFPAWLRVMHYINLLFLTLLIRSGLQILMDHPRLYGNVHCTPGTEWLRLTPIEVPADETYTAKQDARSLSPWIGLPGGKHTVGMARHWHFLSVLFWVVNGLVFVALLFFTDQWKRLLPTNWHIVPDAWSIFVHYATLHLPPEPDGYYRYNALQQLAYFGVVFLLAPMAILTGPSMSPALTSRYRWYPRIPGNRQIGRSLHFLAMCGFVVFIVIHVSLVVSTGFARNMNHIVMNSDNVNPIGLYLGLAGVIVVVALNALAYYLAWKHPRAVQHAARAVVTPVMRSLLGHANQQSEYTREDISPFFWVNGRMPTCVEWKMLAGDDFKDYRLKVCGQVENPVELSLEDMKALCLKSQITLHHCIQGWSGIAEWGGLPLAELIKLVRPTNHAKAVVFYSFSEGLALNDGVEGGQYYDSITIENALNAQTMLAYEMNCKPLTQRHGAPLRLRVENQLGFKMVKWICEIKFVEDIKSINKGEGGYAEDNEYFGELANI